VAASGGAIRNISSQINLIYLKFNGRTANNQAETTAPIEGIKIYTSLKVFPINIKGDSKIIIDILNGRACSKRTRSLVWLYKKEKATR